MHVADSRDAKSKRLFDAVDIAGQSMNMGVNQPRDQGMSSTRDSDCSLRDIFATAPMAEIPDQAILDSNKSVLNELVTGEDFDIFHNESDRIRHASRAMEIDGV